MARLRFVRAAFQREPSANCETLSAFLRRELFTASFTRDADVFSFCLQVGRRLCYIYFSLLLEVNCFGGKAFVLVSACSQFKHTVDLLRGWCGVSFCTWGIAAAELRLKLRFLVLLLQSIADSAIHLLSKKAKAKLTELLHYEGFDLEVHWCQTLLIQTQLSGWRWRRLLEAQNDVNELQHDITEMNN